MDPRDRSEGRHLCEQEKHHWHAISLADNDGYRDIACCRCSATSRFNEADASVFSEGPHDPEADAEAGD